MKLNDLPFVPMKFSDKKLLEERARIKTGDIKMNDKTPILPAVPAPSEPVAWLCDGPHGKSVHIDIRKLRAETGHTLTPLYTHPTAAIDKGALVGLVEKWRELNTTQIGNAFSQGIGQTLAMCADELEAVIDKMWPGAK